MSNLFRFWQIPKQEQQQQLFVFLMAVVAFCGNGFLFVWHVL